MLSFIDLKKHKTKRSMPRYTEGKIKNVPKVKKLPSLSHNTSSSQIKPNSAYRQKNPEKPEEINTSIKEEKSFMGARLKSLHSMDEDFERLNMIANKHYLIRNNSLNIQQRLIEIASSSKLPMIKEVAHSFITEKKVNSQVNSVMQRYHENYRQNLRVFKDFSSNL